MTGRGCVGWGYARAHLPNSIRQGQRGQPGAAQALNGTKYGTDVSGNFGLCQAKKLKVSESASGGNSAGCRRRCLGRARARAGAGAGTAAAAAHYFAAFDGVLQFCRRLEENPARFGTSYDDQL